MTNKDVILAFRKRRQGTSGTLSSDGKVLLSYATCIGEWFGISNVVLNRTKYSPTTSHHQSMLFDEFQKFDGNITFVTGVDRGTRSLEKFAEKQKLENHDIER